MLDERVKEQVVGLSDAALVEYVLTGTRMYKAEAVELARKELERRKLDPETLHQLRQPVLTKLAVADAKNFAAINQPAGCSVLCQGCGIEAPTMYLTYYQNIGMLVMRFHKKYRGHMCKKCNLKYFWKATLIDLTLGWWGVIPFVMTCGFLVTNIATVLKSLSMPGVPEGARAPRLDDKIISKVAPQIGYIDQRLSQMADIHDLARELAPKCGVTAGEALLYIGDSEAPDPGESASNGDAGGTGGGSVMVVAARAPHVPAVL